MSIGTGRVALVTGASAGIGEAAARALLGAGFTVYGTSRRAAAGETRGGVVFLPLDVTDDVSVAGAVREVLDRSGRIDVLVNNAGIGSSGASEESSVAQDQIVFDVNVFGLIRMTKAVLPHMRAQRSGRVINMSSVGGFAPQPFMASYVASSTRSRATPSPWTTRFASTASGFCSSSPSTRAPASTRAWCGVRTHCRSTSEDGTPSKPSWRRG